MHAKYSRYDITRLGVYGGSAGGQNLLQAYNEHSATLVQRLQELPDENGRLPPL